MFFYVVPRTSADLLHRDESSDDVMRSCLNNRTMISEKVMMSSLTAETWLSLPTEKPSFVDGLLKSSV